MSLDDLIVEKVHTLRNRATFEADILPNYAKGSVTSVIATLNTLETFSQQTMQVGFDEIVDHILENSATPQIQIDSLLSLLQKYNNWRLEDFTPVTVKGQMWIIKLYLHYKGARIPKEDYATLKMGKAKSKNGYSFKIEELTRISGVANHNYSAWYAALVSSGMRVGESLQIVKCDMMPVGDRFAITLRAEYTKTQTEREVIISKEASDRIRERWQMLGKDEGVYLPNLTAESMQIRRTAALQNFQRDCKRAGVWGTAGKANPTLHRLRSFFQKMAEKHVTSNWGHRMLGHDGYLPTYGNLDMEEKMDYYDKIEQWVTVQEIEILKVQQKLYENTKNSEIESLKREVEVLADYKREQEFKSAPKSVENSIN